MPKVLPRIRYMAFDITMPSGGVVSIGASTYDHVAWDASVSLHVHDNVPEGIARSRKPRSPEEAARHLKEVVIELAEALKKAEF